VRLECVLNPGERDLMLKSKVNQEYARWWQFWLSKLPPNDSSSVSKVRADVLLKGPSLSILEDRLRFLRNPAKTISPLRCSLGEKGAYLDEES
jgi:hypothetical protein